MCLLLEQAVSFAVAKQSPGVPAMFTTSCPFLQKAWTMPSGHRTPPHGSQITAHVSPTCVLRHLELAGTFPAGMP